MRRTSGAAAATAARRRWPAASKGRRLPRAGTTRLRPSSLPPPGPPGPPCVFLFLFPPSPPPHLRWLGPLVNETSISLRPNRRLTYHHMVPDSDARGHNHGTMRYPPPIHTLHQNGSRRIWHTVPARGGTFTAGPNATSTAQTRIPQPSSIEPVVPSYLALRSGA